MSVPRLYPRTTCDQCGRDYSDAPEQGVTVTLRSHELYWQTICIRCVPSLGITGCTLYPNAEGALQPHERIFGIDRPPRGWKGQRSSPEEILDALANCGYRLPKPERVSERLDFEILLTEINAWRNRAAS